MAALVVSGAGVYQNRSTVYSLHGDGKYQLAPICRHNRRETNSSVKYELSVGRRSRKENYGGLSFSCAFGSASNHSVFSTWRSSRNYDSAPHALADKVASDFGERIGTDADDLEVQTATEGADNWNWEEQWYPLFLTDEIPGDAPLPLQVFDRLLVVYRDGDGKLNCLEDRCPHRLAKLSEGQIIDGRIECLYHGWQFEGDGTCAKIPQLPPGAQIPRRACARSYAVKDSQGVLWVWMGEKSKAPYDEVPYFECCDREGNKIISSYCELPYDASILMENVLDPAHVHISHDRVDQGARREKAQAMVFQVKERSAKGFSGHWHYVSSPHEQNLTRFTGPCASYNERESPDKKMLFSSMMLLRPMGQGRSAIILRFGIAIEGKKDPFPKLPLWYYHLTGNTVFEQDMGFLSSQNEVLIREQKPTSEVYLNMRAQDRWVEEYRMWLDRIGHGMPHYFGHRTLKLAAQPAVQEHFPAGLGANISSTTPAKGAFVHTYARDPTNRYNRHVVHCKSCRAAVTTTQKLTKLSLVLAALSAGMAILASKPVWRISFVVLALLMCAAYSGCQLMLSKLTQNYVRPFKGGL